MRLRAAACVLFCLAAVAEHRPASAAAAARGGQLVVAERTAPRTFNPVLAVDAATRTILERLCADLIHINRRTMKTEAALASSWTVSPDGREYTIALRPNLRFSDGHPFTADDVVFTFEVYLDEKVHAPQRDLLIVGGKPIVVKKKDDRTVVVSLSEPYAVTDRLFDGIWMLPRHILGKAFADGTLARQWGLDAPASSIVGMGPFRLAEHRPGERLVLERNPNYWKHDRSGASLPYLDRLVFVVVPSTDAEMLRFKAGDIDVISQLTADQFGSLQAAGARYQLADAGPGLEYNFLFFNLTDTPPGASAAVARKRSWFRQEDFRHAMSAAIDRQAIVKLVYRGRGEPLWGPVTRGNAAWRNDALPRPARSLDRARELLRKAGFTWRADGTLVDGADTPVEFSILVSSSRPARPQMATVIQSDLAEIGVRVTVTPLDIAAVSDRVLNTRDFEACLMGIGSGDADPNTDINIWLSSSAQHFWNPSSPKPPTPWEAEIDTLMRRQMTARTVGERKQMFDRVQALLAEHEPMIFLASPNILVAAKPTLENFTPAILPHYALWNVDELYWRAASGG
jgi:peptide/nickel transport system substrate-binding protein